MLKSFLVDVWWILWWFLIKHYLFLFLWWFLTTVGSQLGPRFRCAPPRFTWQNGWRDWIRPILKLFHLVFPGVFFLWLFPWYFFIYLVFVGFLALDDQSVGTLDLGWGCLFHHAPKELDQRPSKVSALQVGLIWESCNLHQVTKAVDQIYVQVPRYASYIRLRSPDVSFYFMVVLVCFVFHVKIVLIWKIDSQKFVWWTSIAVGRCLPLWIMPIIIALNLNPSIYCKKRKSYRNLTQPEICSSKNLTKSCWYCIFGSFFLGWQSWDMNSTPAAARNIPNGWRQLTLMSWLWRRCLSSGVRFWMTFRCKKL